MMLLTQVHKRALPVIGTTAMQEDPIAYVKWFCPWGNWTWFCCEYDPKTEECFGLVYGFDAEIGHWTLSELRQTRGPGGLRIERDTSFTAKPLSQCLDPCGGLLNPFHKRPSAELIYPPVMAQPREPIGADAKAEDGTVVRIILHDEYAASDMAQQADAGKLRNEPCKCKESEFHSYPADGACSCGCYKHHVHCKKCLGISQWG